MYGAQQCNGNHFEIRIMGLSGFVGYFEIHLLFNLKAADKQLSVRRDP